MRVGGLAMAVAALAAATGATPARADARRVLLLVGGDRDRALAARVEGQVADLDVAVVTIGAVLPPDPTGQLAAARARALERGAEAVVWFDDAGGGDWLVRVVQGERVLARRVGRVPGELSDSATYEAVGLVVRTALRGLAAGGRIGDEPAERAGRFEPVRPWVELGWTGVVDGTPSGRHGALGRLGVAAGRWRAAAAFEYYPARTLASSLATIRVERQTASLLLGVDVLGPPAAATRWRVGFELGAGAARVARTTTGAGAGLTPTASSGPWSPVICASVRASRRLSSAFWLGLSLGADFLPQAPEFGVNTGTGFERVSALHPVEPRATLSLTFDAS